MFTAKSMPKNKKEDTKVEEAKASKATKGTKGGRGKSKNKAEAASSPKKEETKRGRKRKSIAKNDSDSGEESKARKGKDKAAPKKTPNSFVFYTNSRRPEIMKKHPETKLTEVTKITGAEWQKMSDKEKEPFEKMKEKDEKR